MKAINSSKTILIKAVITILFISSCNYDQNPCYEIKCEDQQICIDGSCVDIEKVSAKSNVVPPPRPDTVILFDFYITRIPETKPDGTSWDSGNNADVFVQIIQNAKILYATPTSIQNLDSQSLPYKLNLSAPLKISKINNVFSINFYDDDGNQFDEFMGGITFTPFQKDYSTVIQADNGGTVAMQISAIYEFK